MADPCVRASILSDYAPFARSRGLDPLALLKRVGIPARCLAQPDQRVRVGKVNRLLELSAAQSNTPDFGLQLSRTRRLSSLGVLGALMRDEQTVRDALERFIANAHLNGTAVWIEVLERAGVALVRMTLDADRQPAIQQATEMALGGLFRILQHLIGATWKPRELHFLHPPVSPPATYRGFFGCAVHCGSDFNAIVLDSQDLDQPIPLSDERLRRYAVQAMAALSTRQRQVTAHAVRQQILALLPDGRGNSEAVSAALGVHRRTLHRHLGAQGLSFVQVRDELRLDLAQQYLRANRLDATHTAQVLGFDSLSSFSRWFKRHTGAAPTHWRAAAANPAAARPPSAGGHDRRPTAAGRSAPRPARAAR